MPTITISHFLNKCLLSKPFSSNTHERASCSTSTGPEQEGQDWNSHNQAKRPLKGFNIGLVIMIMKMIYQIAFLENRRKFHSFNI